MAVTLKDIATITGVSVNTVCRALKDKPDIGMATRQRVKDVASALGYRPNLNARSLVLQKTGIIGVAVTESDNPVRMAFCENLRKLAETSGYRMLTVGLSIQNSEQDTAAIEDLLARGVDGMVIGYQSGILSELPCGSVLQDCAKSDIPVVVFGSPVTGLADTVVTDFREGCYLATSHLLERNLTPVVCCRRQSVAERWDGYCQAMKDHGKADAIRLWEIGDHCLAAGDEAVANNLRQGQKPPGAIVAANDMVAIGILHGLKARGLKVPGDVSVIGIDNIEIGAYLDPALTSIGYTNGSMSENVWKLLASRLESGRKGNPQIVQMHPQLFVRASSR